MFKSRPKLTNNCSTNNRSSLDHGKKDCQLLVTHSEQIRLIDCNNLEKQRYTSISYQNLYKMIFYKFYIYICKSKFSHSQC